MNRQFLQGRKLPFRAILILLTIGLLSSGCATEKAAEYNLPFALGMDQSNVLTVQDFVDTLVDANWVRANPDHTFFPTYSADRYSFLLETTVSVELDGKPPVAYGTTLGLYIQWVGGIAAKPEYVPSAEVHRIWFGTDLTIWESWLIYGIPESGWVWPIFTKEDFEVPRQCAEQSNYIAYYDGGRMLIRAVVKWPLIINFWTTPVEIVYPLGEALEEEVEFVSRFSRLCRMDHNPCDRSWPTC